MRATDHDRALIDRAQRRVHRLLAVAEAVEDIGDDRDVEFALENVEKFAVGDVAHHGLPCCVAEGGPFVFLADVVMPVLVSRVGCCAAAWRGTD